MNPIKLYRNPKSGHCHRVELMLAFLQLPYEVIDVDMASGAHKEESFLKINPFGLVPVIDDNGYMLSDSNAILVYLVQTYAASSNWMPAEPKDAAEVQRWLTIAADNLYSGPCAARLVKVFGASLDHARAVTKSHELLTIMNAHFSDKTWLVTDNITIADVALYSYIAHAPEGGVDLGSYANVRDWLSRIEKLPEYVGMLSSPIPELV